MPEIFNDPEFEKYRVLEIEEGVNILKDAVNGASADYFKGAMDMLKRVMSIPVKMAPEGSQKEQAKSLKAKAFSTFEAKMIRKFAGGDE